MTDLLNRVKALDPAPNDAELPTALWSPADVLNAVDELSRVTPDRERAPRPAAPWAGRWRPALHIAAAAFGVVLVIGLAVVLFGGGEGGSGPVDQPQQTTIPTTTPPSTVAAERTVAETRDIPYAGSQLLDVWAPATPGPWPVLVMLHGVSVTDNTRSGYDPLVEDIARGGVVVYNVEWPTSNRFVDEARIVACAVGFARATAADYGGSADRVTLMGHSNGGSMAATVALAAERLDPIDDCAVTDASVVPDVLVGVAGDYAYAITGPAAFFRDVDPEGWELIDPYSNIGRNPDLEVYLLHGAADDAVPVQSAIDFEAALTAAGYPVQLTILEGVGHNSPVAPTFDAFANTVEVALAASGG